MYIIDKGTCIIMYIHGVWIFNLMYLDVNAV